MTQFPSMGFFDPVMFGIELGFTVIAVIFCFLIYFKTKEIYELTKYKGIRYFRGAFLFFGLSYVMRFLFSLVLLSRIAFDFFLPRHLIMPLFILPLGYLSTVGIFYLIFPTFDSQRAKVADFIKNHSKILICSALRTFFCVSVNGFIYLIAAFFPAILV